MTDQESVKREPNFEDDDDDEIGDVEEGVNKEVRGVPQRDTKEQSRQVVDERGGEEKRKHGGRKRSAGRKGNQMRNKSCASSDVGAEDGQWANPEQHNDFDSAYSKLVEKIYQD